jgi:hypothetical protein
VVENSCGTETTSVSGAHTVASTTAVINISVNSTVGGTVSGGGTNIPYGTEITVSAIPNDACISFVNWTVNGTVVSTENPYTFTATESVNLVANFHKLELDFDNYSPILWNNTFMLDLNKLRTDGYEALGCQWFKNGIEITNTRTGNEFSYSAGPNQGDLLELAPTYYAFQIMTENCGLLSSTKKTISVHTPAPAKPENSKLIAYPNPVPSGSSLTLEGVRKGSQIQIFNRVGLLVKTTVATDNTTILTLHLPIGMYLIHVDNKAIQIFITE